MLGYLVARMAARVAPERRYLCCLGHGRPTAPGRPCRWAGLGL